MAELRIPTLIPGFDELVDGGIPIGSLILLAGNTGAGKTLFSSHMINSNSENSKSLYCGFFESKEDIIKNANNFGFNFSKFIDEEKLVISEFFPILEEGITTIISEIEAEIEKVQPSLLVIDSISTLAGDLKNIQEMRIFLKMIHSITKSKNITVILISELPLNSKKMGLGVEEFIADGIIIMKYAQIREKIRRCLAVLKMRNTHHSMDIWEFEIGSNGIKLKPALQKDDMLVISNNMQFT
ncbi:RAD55 family ATPase [Nitrosopumilus piranensis]|uniref:KaiC domain-containing protein n=1 Tax=Nitrosopumilus piranensis TaxID=1582439 RepID=A0A0C5BY25_9ARCH|nr:ATPase domain-containing protein [Nitrosopumilus piranensis]AJM93214.1 hypothetical protein NPIRD3C_2004 [Nitrosopumilus piranensis]